MKKILRQFKSSFSLIAKNLGRTILTSLGIVIATAIFVIGLIIVNSMIEKDKKYYENFDPYTFLVKASSLTKESLINHFGRNANIYEYLYTDYTYNGLSNDGAKINFEIIGVEEDYLSVPVLSVDKDNSLENPELIGGRSINSSDMLIKMPVININKGYADILFGEGKGVGENLMLNNVVFQVVGILEDTPDVVRSIQTEVSNREIDMRIYIPNSTIESVFYSILSYRIIRFPVVDVDTSLQELGFLNGNNIYSRESCFQAVEEYYLSYQVIIILAFLVISFFSSIIIMISMVYNVKERVFEIGIKRAVGASKDEIRVNFIFESIVYGLIGVVVGFILGVLISFFIQLLLVSSSGFFIISIDITTFVIPMCISLIFVLIAALIPAQIAANTNIIECLKVE